MDTQTSHQPTKRVEDDYLLRGTGRYMADAPLPGQTYACFVRSQHACADIKSIDIKPALAIKGAGLRGAAANVAPPRAVPTDVALSFEVVKVQ